MVRILPSSALPRHKDARGEIVLATFLRDGAAWREIDRLRQRWAIAPTTVVPPPLPNGISSFLPTVYAPTPWPQSLRSRHDRRLEYVHLDALHPGGWVVPKPERHWRVLLRSCEWDSHCRYEWWSDLRELHDAIVPEDDQRDGFEGFRRVAHWLPFLSACMVCDPPPEDLLGFRNAPAIVFDLPPNRNYAEDGSDLPADTRAMFAPPIASPDMASVGLLESSGAASQDVVNAAKLVAFAEGKRRVKSRDRLTAVQCAVWRDQCEWSHREIAERMGWPLRADDHGSHRISDRVLDHLKKGRDILNAVRK